MTGSNIAVVVAWHNPEQIHRFKAAWNIIYEPAWVILQQDKTGAGCAATKNAGVRAAMAMGAEIVVVLDDDCFPEPDGGFRYLDALAEAHARALEPVEMSLFTPVTDPPSRGTPYVLPTTAPVAASMGFWTEVGDYDACAQLVRGATTPMKFHQEPVFGRYFPLCGMNIAFRPGDWEVSRGAQDTAPEAGALPRFWWEFINVPRFDDIWMGWLWQREAYRRGYCFNLNGPIVRHSRQSNVWQNLRDEAKHLERNETLWRDIATHPAGDYESLRKLLPI